MRKPRGEPLIVCKCTSGGWPLFVCTKGGVSEYHDPFGEYAWTTLIYWSEANKIIYGNCSQCQRIFRIRYHGIYNDLTSAEACNPTTMAQALHNDNLWDAVTIVTGEGKVPQIEIVFRVQYRDRNLPLVLTNEEQIWGPESIEDE